MHYDAIIVLGNSINLDGSIIDADKARLGKVAKLYAENTAPAIIVCGLYGYKEVEKPPLSEAQAYANYLESLDIPRDAIRIESKSQDTLANILFAKTDILMKNNWHNLLVIPTRNHSTERIDYILRKVLGGDYTWDILRIGENQDPANLEREAKSLMHTKTFNDPFIDGDHEAIHKELKQTHPAYGGTKYTIEELRKELGH